MCLLSRQLYYCQKAIKPGQRVNPTADVATDANVSTAIVSFAGEEILSLTNL